MFARYMGWNEHADTISDFHAAMGGAIAGAGAWGSCFPLDVLNATMKTYPTRHTLAQTARRIYAELGIRGFFQGWTPCVVRSFPVVAVQMLGVNKTKQFFEA